MRVAIDIRKLRDYGIGTYVRNIVARLAVLDTASEYILISRPDDLEFACTVGPNFRGVISTAGNYSLREQFSIPSILRRERVDVFHAPHYVLPPVLPCPSVVTIHDCIHLMFPQYLPNRLAYTYARTFMWSATHRSSHVLTVSEASKRDILRFYRIPAEKITVAPNAIDDRFNRTPAAEDIARVQERFQLHDPFVLYVGNIKPHKNIERLIEAFALVRTGPLANTKLLIIGDEISKYPTLRRAVHQHKLHKHVRFLGFVGDQTLAALYRLATVFAFPSLYEGFGLPPLEAMASGTPVVTSNVSSLPEVVGDAAILVDPREPTAIAHGLRRALLDPALRAQMRERGLARATHYSWMRTSETILRIYRETAAGR
ncbi:glycosyltransferase family 4 protein [Luteitalea sp.]|jgi:glycosyltransferase involved in cell wall biosynthesis|uniref:glycosyltransferase family 4 protein n=1 Tax=Luteitalea sp. TaxID=2004800 RepID=UPI0037C9143C